MKSHQFYHDKPTHSIELVLISLVDYELKTAISTPDQRLLSALQFGAKLGEVASVVIENQGLVRVYIGSGSATDDQAIAAAVLKLPLGCYQATKPLSLRAMLVWSLAQYRFDAYQKILPMPRILALDSETLSSILIQSDAVFMVRDLINTPSNDMGPEALALYVTQLAQTHKAQCHVWVGDELLTDNYPAIHAVGRASAQQPRLISLTYGKESHPRVTLVGKGVCFDSGGLDLKPSSAMRIMKKDMGGAAQVIGLAHWLMSEQLPIRLQVLIPAVENSVSANAYRPGDVLTMRNGMTVEIDNTDAEGRLVLADALVKACEHSPELLFDFATLTGAARVAVGTEVSAMFSNDDTLAAELMSYGERYSDPVWRLPLYSGYLSLFQSSIADLANSSASPYAGAIVAALFLQYFVAESISWVHFDIMSWNVASKPGKPEGGEAMGILAVGHYLLKRYR